MSFVDEIKAELPALSAAVESVASEIASLAARIPTSGETLSSEDGQAIVDGLTAAVGRLQALSVDPAPVAVDAPLATE